MDWSRNAKDIMRRMDEHRNLLLALAEMPDDDIRWINKHLDMAFEGRHDYLRFSNPEWARIR